MAIGIVVEGGRVLIARRPPGVPMAGLWEFPGGKIEPGETADAAAVRELAEELGLCVVPIGRLGGVVHAYPHGTVRLTPVLCRRTDGRPQALGCAEWRWVLPQALRDYAFPDGSRGVIDELLARLTDGHP